MNQEPILIPEEQPPKNTEKTGAASYLFDVLEMIAWAFFIVFFLFLFVFRLCRVDGDSMENTLYANENLLVYSLAYTPQQDDMIVFHLTRPESGLEKTLVKRVIATGGQTLKIDFVTREILVDGVPYKDAHAVFKGYDHGATNTYLLTEILCAGNPYYNAEKQTMELTVPENKLFVMGDNRNVSLDSRSPKILFVDERCVLGKVILRLSPFTLFS